MTSLVTVLDSTSGNAISGVIIEDDILSVDYAALCGGTVVDLSATPGPFDTFGPNGIDCVTSERISYSFTGSNAVTPPTTNLPIDRAKTFWLENYNGTIGQQWQAHDPDRGARVGLGSGQPLFLTANRCYQPPGAGSSFYRQLCSFPGANYTTQPSFVSLTNADTLLTAYFRFVDNNNHIRIDHVPATQTWNLIEVIAGVPNTLATGNFDLSTNAAAGEQFLIVLLGTAITVSSPSTVLDGSYTTAHTASGSVAFLITATTADDSGFGGSTAQDLATQP